MNDKEQRIEIAKACGWINQGKAKQIPTLEHRWTHKDIHPRFINTEELPDYPNDLNAMHEAEKVLRIQQTPCYVATLSDLCGYAGPRAIAWPYITATARQRAEAFLRTVGKWKDETK